MAMPTTMSNADDEAEAAADLAEEAHFSAAPAAGIAAAEAAPAAPAAGSLEDDFRAFIEPLNLRHISFSELLFLGGSNNSPGSSCFHTNSLPPRELWPNIVPTARVLDELRERLGSPVRLLSIYRNQAYNSCLSGTAPESQHKSMRAIDFAAEDGRGPAHWRAQLLAMRDNEQLFSGGIGIYNTFVHVDTRGPRADWDKRT
jgi:hypothetical protein